MRERAITQNTPHAEHSKPPKRLLVVPARVVCHGCSRSVRIEEAVFEPYGLRYCRRCAGDDHPS